MDADVLYGGTLAVALPQGTEARMYHRAARARLDDARFLLEQGGDRHTTGAVYLAGYSVECMLKALILSITPPGRRAEVVASFRGLAAHDYDRLKARYLGSGGAQFPSEVSGWFTLFGTWAVDLRYEGATYSSRDAADFLRAAEGIWNWADGRM